MAITKNIKYGSGIPTSEAAGKPATVAQHPKTIPGKIYYGNDGLKRNKDGTYSEDMKLYRGGSKHV